MYASQAHHDEGAKERIVRHADDQLHAGLHHRLQGNLEALLRQASLRWLRYAARTADSSESPRRTPPSLSFVHEPRPGRLHDDRKAELPSHHSRACSAFGRELGVQERYRRSRPSGHG